MADLGHRADALRQLRANGGNKVKLYGPFGLSSEARNNAAPAAFDRLRANGGD
jgi:hypothetical protein